MALADIITRLRPATQTSTDLAAAIERAKQAAVEQEAAVAAAKAARDDGLLDADPATLRKAETALADAREQGERVAAVLANLTARHAAAVQAETMANVADLKARTEAAEAALSEWWQKRRAELVPLFAEGLKLSSAASDLRDDHQRAQSAAAQVYPAISTPAPDLQEIDAGTWVLDLSRALDWLHAGSRDRLADVQDIARICDPRPAGSF